MGIGESISIAGNFTIEEAEDLARVLNSGGLPASVKILEEKIIEASHDASFARRPMKMIATKAPRHQGFIFNKTLCVTLCLCVLVANFMVANEK